MKIRDAVMTIHGTPKDQLQHRTVQSVMAIAQAAHEAGLSPLELMECLTMATAHVADIAKRRDQAVSLMRAWADDLENPNTPPIVIQVDGSA